MNRPFRIAVYMRLSKAEDCNAAYCNAEPDGSNSIRMQRQLLCAFVHEHFADCELMEFSDV